jgi:SAM-dependent methyltransferase
VESASTWVQRFAALVGPGATVLDLACGAGRHARLFAARGCLVEALDRDAAALAALAGVPGVSVRCVDLEDGPWPCAGRRFDCVVVTNYLHRPLLPHIADTLAEGGVLIYETFMRGNERFGRPSNPAFLLEPGELLRAFAPALAPLAFEQGEVAAPKPAVLQRLCAVKADVTRRVLPAWPAPGD